MPPDEVVDGNTDSTATLEPPPGAGVPTDDTPTDGDGGTPAPKEGEGKTVVKLPTSVKAPKPAGDGSKSRFQGRISELVAQRKEAEARATTAEGELTKLRGSKPGEKGADGQPQPGANGGLNPDDFPTYGDYIKELAKQTFAEEQKSHQSKAAKEAFDKHVAERRGAFQEAAAPLMEMYGDGFWEAITDPSLPISDVMSDAVLELDGMLAPMTMLYFSSHRDEAAKISKMNPMAAVVQVGRIAAMLDREMKETDGTGAAGEGAPAPQAVPVVSQTTARPAPTVIPSLRGQTPADLTGDPSDKDDVATWLQKEAARMRTKNPHARFYAG